jgi:hypothetical protein
MSDRDITPNLIMVGRLGWGNRKGGYEAFGPEGRWGGQGHYADHGDLLGDALERAGGHEGMTLIVVAVSHRDHKQVEAVEAAVREAVAGVLGTPQSASDPEEAVRDS